MSEQAARTVMPQNWDAEYSLIGSLCCDARAAFPTVLAFIPDETWLSHPDTRVAWRCLRAMYDADEPIDLITVSDRLERMGPPANDRESWAAVMTRFSETVPTWLNAASYARIVAAYALMRQMVQVGLNLQDAASLTKSTSKPIELLAAAQNLARDTARDLEDLAAIIRAQEPDDLADLMRDLAADLEAGTPGRLPTEIMPIDGLTGGLQRGGVTIIGARTSVGKTSLAVTIAKNALREGKRVLFITAEMSSKRIAGRFVAMMTSTPCADIFGDGDSAAGLAAIHSAEQQLARDGVYVRYMNSMREIAPTARWYVERRNVELIIVDYLQLCLPAEQQQTRALAVASMSRAIRAVAIRTGAAMLVLSQFNREACRDGTPPKMSDLYESAAIEQDADGVILLHVPTPRDGPYQDMQAIIPKNRDGKKGTVQIRAYYPSMEFRSGYED